MWPDRSADQQQQVAFLEAIICAERPAVQPRLQPEVDAFCEWLASHAEKAACLCPAVTSGSKQLACEEDKSHIEQNLQFSLRMAAPVSQQQVQALERTICAHGTAAMPRRECVTASKLCIAETELGNKLSRPRRPKSLRQLYCNSADAECRAMSIFHRARDACGRHISAVARIYAPNAKKGGLAPMSQ